MAKVWTQGGVCARDVNTVARLGTQNSVWAGPRCGQARDTRLSSQTHFPLLRE